MVFQSSTPIIFIPYDSPCEVSVINPIQEYDNGDNVAVSICQALTAFQVLIWWFVGMVSFVPHPPYKAVNR